MKRKVIKIADTTYVVSIPLKWARKHNIQKGDELDLEEKGSEIILRLNESETVQKKVLFDADKYIPITRRVFDALYKKGYDEVTVKFNSKEVLKDIENAISNEAMNFEIVRQEKNTCVVRSITEASTQEFDSILRRVFLLVKVMGEDLYTALRNKDFETVENIKSLEKTNNKLTHFLRRSLNKTGYKEYEKTALVYTIVEQLEKVADELKFLCDFLADGRNKTLSLSDETFSLFEDLNKSLIIFSNLFFDFNESKVVELYKLKESIVKRGLELFHTKKSKEVVVIHYLINIEKMVFDIVGPILAATL